MDNGRPPDRGSTELGAGLAARARAKQLAAGLLIVVCFAVAAAVYTQQGFDLDPRALRERIEGFGWLAPLAYVAAAALRPFLFLPSWVVMSAGGLLFGVTGGILWGSLGFTLGAVMAFVIARALGRDAVAARLRGRGSHVDRYVTERGAPWMALYTAVPITVLTPVHTGAGLSGMTLGAFALAAIAGFLPRTGLYSFFGDSIRQGMEQGDWGNAGVGLGLIAVAGVVGITVAQRWGRARAQRSAETVVEEKAGTP